MALTKDRRYEKEFWVGGEEHHYNNYNKDIYIRQTTTRETLAALISTGGSTLRGVAYIKRRFGSTQQIQCNYLSTGWTL